MQGKTITQLAVGAALALALAGALAAEHPAIKRAVDLPPSADLT